MTSKTLDKNFTIGILGAGAMGRGIAQVAALGGLSVMMVDGKDGVAEEAHGFIKKMLDRAAEKKRLEQADAAKAMTLIGVSNDINSLKDCNLVIDQYNF